MAKPLSIAERVIVHTLLDARGPVPIATLAELTGVVPHSVRSAISAVRPALAEVGVRISCNGTLAGARYCLHAPDRAAVRALIGPKVERPCFMGFLDRYGTVLKVIVEAAGRPVSANEIAGAVYARDHGETRRRVSSMIREIRATLAKQGAAETIHQAGPAAAPVYAWGSAAEASEAVVMPSEGVTLPSVAGVYRYAAGRLTLDGRPAGRMA